MPSQTTPNNSWKSSLNVRFHFAGWTADPQSGELFYKGEKVHLQEKPFQVLLELLKLPGELVTREQLALSIWPDSDSIADASLNTAVRKLRAALQDSPRDPRIIETVGNRGYRLLVKPEVVSSDVAVGPVRLAIMPFQNLSASEHDRSADWLTEQMIVQLADPQADIRVIVPVLARHQGKKRKNGGAQIPDPGEAEYVLNGSVIFTGNLMRVNAKLIRASDQVCLWSESYRRQMNDIFRAQDEITLHIACSILQVIPKPAAQSRDYNTTPSAYGKTLKGRHIADKWNEPSFERAIVIFEQAIADDPDFARAHSALARTYANMLQYGVHEPSVNYEKLRLEAGKALDLCPDLPEPIVALGCGELFYKADWFAAGKHIARALQVSPGSAWGYQCATRLFFTSGRHEEAIRTARRAHELDPLSPYSNTALGAALCYARKFEEAIGPCADCIEMEPEFSMARAMLGRAYEGLGRFEEAIGAYKSALECAPNSSVMLANLASGLAVAHKLDEAREYLAQLLELRNSSYVPPYWIAVCYFSLGEYEQGITWLRIAADNHCGWRLLASIDPKLDAVREEAEFKSVLAQIGFPQVAASERDSS